MRYSRLLLLPFAFLLMQNSLFGQGVTTVTITPEILQQHVKRFGINIGSRNRWGGAQFLKNLIDNPGFESGVMGMVALGANGSSATMFRQAYWNTDWGGQGEGFWDNADYEIVWGNAKGRSGMVNRFYHDNGAYVFDLGESDVVPGENDVMFVRTEVPGINGNLALADPEQARPGSLGTQSLRLASDETDQWNFYMDSYWRDGDRSIGKMLPVKGGWHCDVWAKGEQGGETARIRFFRENEASFLDEEITLTDEWQHFEWMFDVADGTDPVREYSGSEYRPILGFRLQATDGTVWFDDVVLERADQENPTVFTDLFVQRLRELNPGIVRNWSTQLGATLETELSEVWGRKTNGYKPGGSASAWGYSLHEFLELTQELNKYSEMRVNTESEPWYVIPPTFSSEDLQGLIEYLAAPAIPENPWAMRRAELGQQQPWTKVFRKIHLEFGNELWGSAEANDPFQGASLRGGVRLGNVASDRFTILRSSKFYQPNRWSFNFIIGGQAGFAGRQQEIEANATAHHEVALAPYFGVLNTWENDEEIFQPLFAHPTWQTGTDGRVQESYGYLQNGGNGTGLGVYEINFHTTGGSAPIDVRNDFLTSAAGGLALPLAMLTYQRDVGAINQCAFTSLGYSFRMRNGEYARVWGMLRDLYATGRKRPTWLGLELANKAIWQLGDISDEMITSVRVQKTGKRPFWLENDRNGISGEVEVDAVQAFAFTSLYNFGCNV